MEKCNHVKGRISNLPDEILIAILSFLPLKEAGRSSVLSRRWTNLWKFTGNMDFDFDDTRFLECFIQLGTVRRSRYINWVDQVLKSHRSSTINKFRLRHDLNKSFGYVIDRWIEFGIEKKVQMLELDFSDIWGGTRLADAYVFPKSVLNYSALDFSNLTSLSLVSVNLTDEILSYFFITCTFLERLTIKDSFSLVNFTLINGPSSLKLKYLEIGGCTCLENIEISAINLIVFKYDGHDLNMSLNNIPALAECSLGGEYLRILILESGEFPFWFSQLQKLVMNMNFYRMAEVYDRSAFYLRTFPKFEKLKHLELEIHIYQNESLKFLDSLIQASPQVHKLVITLIHVEPPKQKARLDDETHKLERLSSIEPCSHQHLDIVEFLGWRGYEGDADFVVYLCEHAPRLSKVIIDPRHPKLWRRYLDLEEEEAIEAIAREHAEFLAQKLPSNVELQVVLH